MTNEEIFRKYMSLLYYDEDGDVDRVKENNPKRWEYTLRAMEEYAQQKVAEATKEMFTEDDLVDAWCSAKDDEFDLQNNPNHTSKSFNQWLSEYKQKKNNQSNTANVNYPTQAE